MDISCQWWYCFVLNLFNCLNIAQIFNVYNVTEAIEFWYLSLLCVVTYGPNLEEQFPAEDAT